LSERIGAFMSRDDSESEFCKCGRPLPEARSLHIHRCECGRVWLRPDCSEDCSAGWAEY
jgi:hypothetical protein